jgi:hypothetical protein
MTEVTTVDDGCDVSEDCCVELACVEAPVLLAVVGVEDVLWGVLEVCCWEEVVSTVDDCMVDVEMGVEEVVAKAEVGLLLATERLEVGTVEVDAGELD